MQNQNQSLSDTQQQLINDFKPPPSWFEPNPPLLPSPFPWSSSYTSPAWGQPVGQMGGAITHSNQFNSAITQPLGMHVDWLGKEKMTGNSQLGGAIEPSEYFYDGYTRVPLLQNHKAPSQKFSGKGKRKGKKQKGKGAINKFTYEMGPIGAVLSTPESNKSLKKLREWKHAIKN